MCVLAAASVAGDIPAGQVVEARLLTACGTRLSKSGDSLRAVLISPIVEGERVVVPAGTEIEGTVTKVSKLGFGIKNGRATLGVRFHTLHWGDGTSVPLETTLVQVDTARERVDDLGQVYGISSTITVSGALAIYAWRVVILEPVVGGAIWATKFLFAPAPDPEITFPRGTEMLLRVTNNTWVPRPVSDSAIRTLSVNEETDWQVLMDALPTLRVQRKSGADGDRINVALAGEPEAIERAFKAAGWSESENRSAGSIAQTYYSIVERRGYSTAPMAPMHFNSDRPGMMFQKSLNTFARRHHLRLWQVGRNKAGVPLWVGSATEDTDIHFSKNSKRWTHAIDEEIDNERTKILSDLMFTGCVASAALVKVKPVHVPGVHTDGLVAVANVDSCMLPRPMPLAEPQQKQMSRFTRGFTALVRDVVRSNPVTLGFTTVHVPPQTFLGRPSPGKQRSLWAEQQASLWGRKPVGPVVAKP